MRPNQIYCQALPLPKAAWAHRGFRCRTGLRCSNKREHLNGSAGPPKSFLTADTGDIAARAGENRRQMSAPPPTARPSSVTLSANDTAAGNSSRRARLRDQLAFLRLLARETSWGNAAAYVFSRLTAKLLPGVKVIRYLLVAQPIPKTLNVANRPSSSISVAFVAHEDYRYDWFPRPQPNIDARFAQGACCFVAFVRGKPAGCIWWKQGPYMEDEVRCRFVTAPGEATMWDFDVYVAPEHRASRVFAYLWKAAADSARHRGIAWTMSRINGFNLESIRSHRRLGARIVGLATFVTAGSVQLSLIPNAPFLHLSWTPRKLPTVYVQAPGEVDD